MKNPSTVSGSGNATVPLEIRKRIGRSARHEVQGETQIGPRGSETNPFEKYKGVLKPSRSRKEIKAWISEMRDEGKRDR